MRTTVVTILAFAAIFNSFCIFAQEVFISPKLEKIWETPEGLKVPESAHYNQHDQIIYISNIAEKQDNEENAGFISKVNTKGEFITKKWFEGLKAPKGIACTNARLYVADVDKVLEIDLKTAKIIKTYRNEKSKSLNDVTIASNGRVYISDSNGKCIFYVGKDSLEVFFESDELSRMNGILAKENLLYLGTNGNFISIDQQTKAITVLAENVGYLDGIEQIAPKIFVTSDWKGTTQLIEIGKGVEKLMDTTQLNINSADLGYIPSLKLLLVPTFKDNKVIAYKLKL
jgi:hypothetical protein